MEVLRGVNALLSTLEKGVHTSVMWDNNDFGEQMLSGQGTTHNTNGIAVQHEILPLVAAAPSIVLEKKKQRTLPAPEKDLLPFRGQKKVSSQPFASDVNLDFKLADETLQKNQTKETAYKLTTMPRDRLLRSWTGFKQLVCEIFWLKQK